MRSRHLVIPIFIVPLILFSCSQVKTVEQIFLESDDVVSVRSNPDGSDAFKAYLNSLETSSKSGISAGWSTSMSLPTKRSAVPISATMPCKNMLKRDI